MSRVPEEVREKAKIRAWRQHRSLNKYVLHLILKDLEMELPLPKEEPAEGDPLSEFEFSL
jgi:hypothetical protein